MSTEPDAALPTAYQKPYNEVFPERRGRAMWSEFKPTRTGGNADVRFEKCNGSLRAVKIIQKQATYRQPKYLARELNTLFTFSYYEKLQQLGLFVKAYEWCDTEYATYITMEYCNQGDLESFAERVRRSSRSCDYIGDFISIFTQMADGLAYMHSAGFAHCDFTAKNILLVNSLDADGATKYNIRIADFGLSKHIREMTGTTEAGGSNWYMSPELAMHKFLGGRGDLDPCACDCWAFGICIYYVLVGDPLHAELARITHEDNRDEDREIGALTLFEADLLSKTTDDWKEFLIWGILLEGVLLLNPQSRSTAKTVRDAMRGSNFQEYWL